jgi:HAD superfamily hydrolase (TIGR01509 family)
MTWRSIAAKSLGTLSIARVTAFPQVRALIQRLLRDGKQVALASSAKQDELAKYKQIAQIEDLIDKETSSDDAERSKPEPDIFQAALQRLGNLSTEQVLVVGDTPMMRRLRPRPACAQSVCCAEGG